MQNVMYILQAKVGMEGVCVGKAQRVLCVVTLFWGARWYRTLGSGVRDNTAAILALRDEADGHAPSRSYSSSTDLPRWTTIKSRSLLATDFPNEAETLGKRRLWNAFGGSFRTLQFSVSYTRLYLHIER